MSNDDAVILGASGFVGSRLTASLIRGGARGLRALDIEPPRKRLEEVRYAAVDVRQPIPIECGQGASIIYNLAAIHRTPGHPEHEYFETNVAGALNAVALAQACDIKTIVFTSSISVYGPCEELVSETSPLHPVSGYGRSKRLAEQIHRQWQAGAPGRRLVIVRPGVIFGPGEGGNYTQLAKALRRGYFFYPGRRDTVKSGGYIDELIRTLDFAVQRGEPLVLFNFAYPQQSTTEDIVHTFAEVAGFRASRATLPLGVMLAAAQAIRLANAVGFSSWIHPDRVMKLVRSTRIAPDWLLDAGYQFETDLKSALTRWRDETDGRFD